MALERSEKRHRYIVLSVLLLHGLTLAWSATWQSPTLNEPGHLASGIAHWELGRFDPDRVNPPLVRLIAATPVLLSGCERDWSHFVSGPGVRSEFQLGRDFVAANGTRTIWLLNIARWACIPFSLVGGWFCYLWGTALWDRPAGTIACVLWSVSPNILAHGQLMTTDVAASSLGLAGSYCFWTWLEFPTRKRCVITGTLFGLALLAKSTWVILYLLWPVIWLICKLRKRRQNHTPEIDDRSTFRSELAQLAAIFLLGTYILNLGYGFDGTFTKLRQFEFVSQTLGAPQNDRVSGNVFRETLLGAVPIPFPRQFVLGIDHQKKDFEEFPFRSYLRGRWKQGGWWYYYLYGFLVKVPVGTLGLVLLSSATLAVPVNPRTATRSKDNLNGLIVLLFPAVAIVCIASRQTAFNHHFRYVLPAFGPMFIFASRSFAVSSTRLYRTRWIRATATLLLACTCLATISAAPRFISYFNLIAGGSSNGHQHMIHSSLDWGQDLYHLQSWLKKHPQEQPIILAYYGLYDPADLGINYRAAPYGPGSRSADKVPPGTPGVYAISVNYVLGAKWQLSGGEYHDFRDREPIEICGDSIWLFDLP